MTIWDKWGLIFRAQFSESISRESMISSWKSNASNLCLIDLEILSKNVVSSSYCVWHHKSITCACVVNKPSIVQIRDRVNQSLTAESSHSLVDCYWIYEGIIKARLHSWDFTVIASVWPGCKYSNSMNLARESNSNLRCHCPTRVKSTYGKVFGWLHRECWS